MRENEVAGRSEGQGTERGSQVDRVDLGDGRRHQAKNQQERLTIGSTILFSRGLRPSRGHQSLVAAGVVAWELHPTMRNLTGRAVGAVGALRLWWRRSRPAFEGMPLPTTQISLSPGCLTWLSCLECKESRVAEFRHGLRGPLSVSGGASLLFLAVRLNHVQRKFSGTHDGL